MRTGRNKCTTHKLPEKATQCHSRNSVSFWEDSCLYPSATGTVGSWDLLIVCL